MILETIMLNVLFTKSKKSAMSQELVLLKYTISEFLQHIPFTLQSTFTEVCNIYLKRNVLNIHISRGLHVVSDQ